MARPKENSLQFANFVCKFGDNLNLIDLADEVVLPAFLDNNQYRKYGDTTYQFHQVELLKFTSDQITYLVLAGRFIKDTKLKREQIFNPTKGIIKDDAQIDSAPSAIFALILNNHKLLYYPEVSGAPGFKTFGSTAASFLKEKHSDFIRLTVANRKINTANEKINKKDIRQAVVKEFPYPEVEVIPISSEGSLREFLQQFQTLSDVSIKLLATNNEIDNSDFFNKFRSNSHKLNATSASMNYHSTVGISKSKVQGIVGPAVRDAMAYILFKGTDSRGDKISGNNEKFNFKMLTTNMPSDVKSATKVMLKKFIQAVSSKTISLPKQHDSKETNESLKSITDNRNLPNDEL